MVVTGFFVLCEQKRDCRLSGTSTVQNVIFTTKVTTLNKDKINLYLLPYLKHSMRHTKPASFICGKRIYAVFQLDLDKHSLRNHL